MEDKKSFSKMLGSFFAGKGFYIALLLCAGLIATSIWLLTDRSGTDVETQPGKETEMTSAAAMSRDVAKEKEEAAVEAMTETTIGTVPEPEAPAVQQEMPQNKKPENAPAAGYFIWPVSGELERDYSMEELSYDRTMSDWRVHNGWDIAAAAGAPVLAVGDGTVCAVYEDVMYGTVVEIDHGNGVKSVYANLQSTPVVKAGDSVSVGDTIGAVGTTALAENAEVSHLHFAMAQGDAPADPAVWMPEK